MKCSPSKITQRFYKKTSSSVSITSFFPTPSTTDEAPGLFGNTNRNLPPRVFLSENIASYKSSQLGTLGNFGREIVFTKLS